ncbi:MAG: sigma-70 family RNA polymerase sigma factor [Gammaproteobacteria bacterium]|nr:sigma-70 family RNA polymerase sigma factor [Gammaproteobacteria bacterium]
MPALPGYYAEGPEALVVSLAAKGDRAAFAELVRRRQSWVRTLLRRCSGDPSLADDLSQQVFMQAWRKIRQLKDADKFGAWLKQMAINQWLQHKRKNDALRGAEGEESIVGMRLDKTSIALDLDRAMSLLPAPVSLCIALSYHERMTHDEIAELTGMQLGTVKSHIRRGSQRLRELLSAYDETKELEDANE